MSKINNTTRLLASLGCASGPNFTSGIISIINTYWPLVIPILFIIKITNFAIVFNIEIMPDVKLGPEAQPRDANNRVVLFILDT